jgi:uncharacterized protein (DUF2236 family)
MVEGPVLEVGAIARAQRADLARVAPSGSFSAIYGESWARRWSRVVDRPLAKRAFARSAHLFAAGMLPARLREAYGYRWDIRDRAAYAALLSTLRLAVRALPERRRFLPSYRWALARERGAA